MDLNSLIFPAPAASYDSNTFPGELLWIPRTGRRPHPCIFLQHLLGSSKLLLFFHGNAEDIGLAYDLCTQLRYHLKVHVLIVEYPGYGLYAAHPSAETICEDADLLIEYLTTVMEWRVENIFVFGRSIGSGPACYLASKFHMGCLILMSAYTSIRSVVKHLAGRVAQYFVSQRFNNLELMTSVTAPAFFLHGQRDTLIPPSESQALHAKCQGLSFIHLPEHMDHNEFEYIDDLIYPLAEFLRKCGISTDAVRGERSFLMFSEELFAVPEGQTVPLNQGRVNRLLRRINS